MSGYILTYTKTRFYPLEPVAEDIKIEDIAHALSMMTRARGIKYRKGAGVSPLPVQIAQHGVRWRSPVPSPAVV